MRKTLSAPTRMLCLCLSFTVLFLLFMTGCVQGVKSSENSSSVLSQTPTGPDIVFDRTIVLDELLKDLLAIDWQDMHSATVRKYVDNALVSTTYMKDEEQFSQIEKFVGRLVVVHATADTDVEPEENVVYEIIFNAEGSDEDDGQFLSLGPVYEDGSFAIGGSFIAEQELNPRTRLLQTNTFVLFEELEEVLATD